MSGEGPSFTPRGTPSRRGKSPRFATPSPSQPDPKQQLSTSPLVPYDSPSTATPRGTPSRRGKSPHVATPGSAKVTSQALQSANKPSTTFYSCISIPVEGAVPINPPSDEPAPPVPAVAESSSSASARAPRKSKTEALMAIKTRSRSASIGEDDAPEDVLAVKYRDAPAIIPPSPILDLSTVKTISPRPDSLPHKEPRPFGLQDCPAFYPTAEEFKDPMAYIRTISDRANAYGICKVVPPVGWKMPFVTDTANFRFKTRLQRLNSVEASSRAKINFLEQLYVWHQQQGNPRVSVPTINNKPLDLYLLRKEVRKLGGFYVVTKKKLWSDLGRILGYHGIPGLSTQLKNSYTRVILPFEEYEAKNASKEASKPPSPKKPVNGHGHGHANGHAHANGHGDEKRPRSTLSAKSMDNTPPDSPLTSTSSPLSEPPEDGEHKANGTKPPSTRPRRSTRMGSHDQSSKTPGPSTLAPSPLPPPVFHDTKELKGTPEQNCEICHKKNRGDEMLLCDGCDCGFHMFCLDPPLDTIPKEQWFCYTCLAGTGGDYGFDEGDEHSLSSFQARDAEFRRVWFESHPPAKDPDALEIDDPTSSRIGNVTVSEYDLETEFWRLVNTQDETVEVEYGADVHSTTHGSAMPTMETHPLNPYAKDPWNLNNIPIVSDSLLRFIKSDISGMTVPWTYVGMTFSTFCWHNEDHYTYSINFMHWGETKTWYGVPGSDAEKFEAAIKGEAPDLFQAQPDLLFQLVTLMNPKRVTDAGVRVYACNQRAGEFVITCPKSYHAGFNHGFNFNEAVNFALPDWLGYGRECVQRYREHRKLPVFSHDELLITITQQSQSIKTALWLIDSLQEMTDRELRDRQAARAMAMSEILEEEDRPEDQYQCTVCKAFCYLSQVTCGCKTAIACVEHAHLLCDRSSDHLTLRKRFSDEELIETLNTVSMRAAIPSGWRAKLGKVLMESARPQLRSLRALYSEGERISFPLPELGSLRKCVGRANEWIDSANSFLVRKQSRKRLRRSRGRPPLHEPPPPPSDDPGDRPDKGLDELYTLLRDVENLGFDSPEIGALRLLAETAEKMKQRASALLGSTHQAADREEFIAECRRVLVDGSSINVLLDELVEVEKIVDREQLIRELETRVDEHESPILLDEVRDLLTRARSCNLPLDNPQVQQLEARLRAGSTWEERARAILDQPIKTIEELEEFAKMDEDIPIDATVYNRLMLALAKAQDFERVAMNWMRPEHDAPRPKVHEVIRLVTRCEKDYRIAAVQDIHKTALIAQDLETRCDQVLKNRYHAEEEMFETMNQWKMYAQTHLQMFTLPYFEKLNTQLFAHQQWVKGLPWYCPEHEVAEAKSIVEDVIENTRPEDDLPPTDEFFTCICNVAVRPPPPGVQSDAVQCDHCAARFHGDCANNGGSCPFCDHHHWNGSIHKERSWHYCFLPTIMLQAPEISKNYSEEWRQLELVVHRIDRLSSVIGQFLTFTATPENQRAEYLQQVRHYMRKLYKIQFAVAPTPDVSFGLDLAGLHRIIALRKGPVSEKHRLKLETRRREKELAAQKKARRPRFTFGQDTDSDWKDGTRCICRGRTPYLLYYPMVTCTNCNHVYHAGCVFFPDDSGKNKDARFLCPICITRKNNTYPYADVRVRPPADMRMPSDQYVDVRKMMDTSTKELIFKTMKPPFTKTLFLEVVKVTTLESTTSSSSPTASRAPATPERPSRAVYRPHPYRHPHAREPTVQSPPVTQSVVPVASQSVQSAPPPPASVAAPPPPPPWSRWGGPADGGSPSSSSTSKKRKLEELGAFQEPVPIYPKRRAAEPASPERNGNNNFVTPPPEPTRQSSSTQDSPQRLSPSLAKIVISGTQSSPRSHAHPFQNHVLMAPRP
ncbi:jumonji superfamily protein [Mycena metata]|uniref:[histone H3]-trimethyl-L-lysine(4) demethylase n=1 Tax=Mycena metata TaxID=1033252 RepID=A0AAD7IE35_9AGAR|nr:jumonji superfamily protein [Mycena metata]